MDTALLKFVYICTDNADWVSVLGAKSLGLSFSDFLLNRRNSLGDGNLFSIPEFSNESCKHQGENQTKFSGFGRLTTFRVYFSELLSSKKRK